jgi:hypothetical protein
VVDRSPSPDASELEHRIAALELEQRAPRAAPEDKTYAFGIVSTAASSKELEHSTHATHPKQAERNKRQAFASSANASPRSASLGGAHQAEGLLPLPSAPSFSEPPNGQGSARDGRTFGMLAEAIGSSTAKAGELWGAVVPAIAGRWFVRPR